MLNIDIAINSFRQFARFWKNGETAKFEMSCENGTLGMNMSANLGHPDLLHFPHPPPPFSPPPAPYIRKTPSQLRRMERRQKEKADKGKVQENKSDEESEDDEDNLETPATSKNENSTFKIADEQLSSSPPVQW